MKRVVIDGRSHIVCRPGPVRIMTDPMCTHGDAESANRLLSVLLECPRHNGRFDLGRRGHGARAREPLRSVPPCSARNDLVDRRLARAASLTQ